MGSFKNVGKRIISGLLCLAMCLTLVSSLPTQVAHADSNSRMQVNIQWAQNKGFEDMTEANLGEYTSDDLRMIGVFLSNFYSPFSTCLGKASDEAAEETKENMKNALADQCNFDEDVAEYFVELIWEMSLETAKPLKFGKINDGVDVISWSYNDKFINEEEHLVKGIQVNNDKDQMMFGPNAEGETEASMYNFLILTSGTLGDKEDLALFCADSDSKRAPSDEEHHGFKSFVMYWTDDDGEDHIVWSNTVGRGEQSKGNMFTASTTAYGMLNDSLSYDYGLGGAGLLSVSLEEYDELSGKDKERVWLYNSKLYVDCFGNIIMDNGILQTVILPACQNPYAWYNYEYGEISAGKYVNMCNLYMLGEATEGHIKLNEESEGVYREDNPVKGVIHRNYLDYYYYAGSNSLFNQNLFRLYYGDAETRVDKDIGPFNSDEGKEQKKMFDDGKYFTKSGSSDESLQFYSWHCFANGSWSNEEYRTPPDTVKIQDFECNTSDPWFFKGTFNDICMIDNINAFEEDSDAITTTTVFNYDGEVLGGGVLPSPKFSSVKDRNNFVKLSGASSKVYLTSIFLSYVYAYYDESTGDDRKISWAYNKNAFPDIANNIDWSEIEISSTKMYDETLSLVYLFLHPSEGLNVVKTWFKNKVSSILLGWHEDMVGKAGAASTTGSTKYVGFSGYVTLPSLYDLEWTSFMMESYDQLVVYFIILILIILLGYKMIGTLTWQKVVLSGLLFAVCAYLPPRLINATVDASNELCNSFYGDKFTYWALVQHEQYASAINNAVTEGNEWNYLNTVFEQQAKESADSYALVTVKWQCPKKENYWADVKDEITQVSNSGINKFIMPLVRDTIDGETYTDAANNQYLYRSYTDIGTYANSLYKNGTMESLGSTGDTSSSRAGTIAFEALRESVTSSGYKFDNSNEDARNRWLYAYREPYLCKQSGISMSVKSDYDTRTATTQLQSIALGFNFDTARQAGNTYLLTGQQTYLTGDSRYKTNRRLTDFSYCASVNMAWMRGLSTMSDSAGSAHLGHGFVSYNPVYGVPLEAFNTTLADVNGRADGDMGGLSTQEFIKDSNVASLIFANYTESPFMYFSYNLNDQLAAAANRGEATTYKDLFLLPDGGYFYNMLTVEKNTNLVKTDGTGTPASDGYGEMRDYMDMRSLFHVVIPYLKSINDVVVEYDNVHGLFMYDGVNLEYDSENNIELPAELENLITGTPYHGNSSSITAGGEDYYKYVHNWEVAQLLNMYTPWVDVMYDCSYADGENIYVLGEKFHVKDPLDPLSYYEQDASGRIVAGREMVFSRSEMAYYGLGMEDLTQVEQKIITINDNCYEDLLQILDYYNFQPEVLNTAIAMLETFEFNRQFSETSLIGTDYVLYPQNYELKNFSYDAYLRLILAGTTGEDLNSLEEADIYTTVVKNSSILTGLLFILLDLFAVYAIPALKLFFIIGIFFMSILMILVATIRLEVKLSKALGESLIFPLLKFFGVTVGMAWLVSLFMYDGNTAVTGRKSTIISLGDPTMVIIVMLVINIAVLVLYWKICKGVFKDCKKYAQAVGTSVGGMFGGAVAMLGAGALLGSRRGGSLRSILPRKTNNDGSDGAVTNAQTGGSGGGGSTRGSGSSGGNDAPAFNADGTANHLDRNGKPYIPKKKKETAEHNKYDAKIDKAKERASSKTNREMDKLSAREDVNTRRRNLEDTYRSHIDDNTMSSRQKMNFEKKADKLKKTREKSEARVNRDFDRLLAKDDARNQKLNKKVDKLSSKSDSRREKLSRQRAVGIDKSMLKQSKKQSRTAGKKKK